MFKAKYPIHSIRTGQYTKGKQYRHWDSLTEYIGLYHVLPNGQIWTDHEPSPQSIMLVEIKPTDSQTVITYNNIKNIIPVESSSPTPYYPKPNDQQYLDGYIYRCFVQKRNNPYPTIIEINSDQFNAMSTANSNSINPVIWNSVEIKWMLDKKLAVDMNRNNIAEAEKTFKGLARYLTNHLEFCR